MINNYNNYGYPSPFPPGIAPNVSCNPPGIHPSSFVPPGMTSNFACGPPGISPTTSFNPPNITNSTYNPPGIPLNTPYMYPQNPFIPYYYQYQPNYQAPFGYNKNYYPNNSYAKEQDKLKDVDIEKLLTKIDFAARDQGSCRLLQKKLDEGDKEFINKVFEGLIPSMETYMNDPFGNYLCQKLFELCYPNQIGIIIDSIAENIVSIATNLHGTRAVQKIIERSISDPDLLPKMIQILSTHVTELVMDGNGNHVMQLCLSNIKSPYNEFIYEEVNANCLKIAMHKHGCCILQKCIDYADEIQKVFMLIN